MIAKQFRENWLLLFVIVLAIALVLAVGLVFAQANGIPPARLIRDPLQIAGLPSYAGYVSNLGILGWMSATTTCAFTFALVRLKYKPDAWFFLASSLCTAVLMLDDFFVIHETAHRLLPGLTDSNLSVFYMTMLGLYFLCFYRRIRQSPFIILSFALLALGVSTCMDVLWHYEVESINAFIEDSLKFAGICFWSAYFMVTSYRTIMSKS